MAEPGKDTDRTEILKAIKDSIKDARLTVQKLAEVFTENIRTLRVEESERVFTNLEQNIYDLEYFLRFLTELKKGMSYFNGFDLPSDPFSSHNTALHLFQEMCSAFEVKDWIMLSDLIEYELSPLLLKEDEWLGGLDDKLVAYEA